MITNHRKYLPSFAEKIDRLTICGLKEIYSENKEPFRQEIADILHDIQLDIDEGVIVTADMIRAIIVLTQANLEIWKNENSVREMNETGDAEKVAKTLLYTHAVNSTRCSGKTRIQNILGGRVDPKISYIGSAWDIKW